MELQTQMTTHLAIARKCNPGFSERFNLFVKEREHSQASESDNSGEGAKDLVSIVEFQVRYSTQAAAFVTATGCVHFVQSNRSLTKSFDSLLAALPVLVL